MKSYSSDQLKALLVGELSTEQESAIANALERDPMLLERLERLSGAGHWLKGGSPALVEITSPSLESAIEHVVSESRIERLSGARSGSEPFDLGESKSEVTQNDDSMHFAIEVPGIRIVREIGRGGMGIVYEGWDEHVGRKVAIKQLLPMRGSAQNAKERLLQEARAAGSLLHPNIVSIYGVHFQNDMPVLVQQYVEGETLQERINSKRYLSWQECVDTAKQIASGLEAAHAAGIVHRDLKPDNILIEASTNIVRIADFGIAKQSTVTGLTATDKIAGTPAYMSPEQTAGDLLDARSDLFSLGSVLVAAVAGTPPFGLDDPFVVMDRIRTQEAKRLSDFSRDCPAWLDELVDRLLRKDRGTRIASASELIEALKVKSLPRMRRRLNRSRATLVAACGILAAGAIFSPWFQKGTDRSADNQLPAESPPTIASGQTPLNEFAPSKSVWIRRDASEFDSLADAIQSASDGDVIEIGADLECEPITIRGKKLTLKGAANIRPVIRSVNRKGTSENSDGYFLRTETDLTLEGIEIQWVASAQIPFFDEKKLNAVVGAAPGTRLTIDRCKIVRSAGGVCLATGGHLEMRRTSVEGASIAFAWLAHHTQATIEDCLFDSRMGIAIVYPQANAAVYSRSSLKLRHCTIRAVDAFSAMLSRRPDQPVSMDLQDTIFDVGHAVSLMSLSTTVRDQIETQPIPTMRSCIEISEARCVYNNKCDFLVTRRIKTIERVIRTRASSLEQWLALAPNSDNVEATQSIVAKLIRIPVETDVPNSKWYQFETLSETPLPSWIDQVGPTSAIPASL